MSVVSSVCCYCGTGCGVLIESDAGEITGVRGDPAHSANFDKLCTRGAMRHLPQRTSGRALHPASRADRAAPSERMSWGTALDRVAEKLNAGIREHGPVAPPILFRCIEAVRHPHSARLIASNRGAA